jgi:hypothetical protein
VSQTGTAAAAFWDLFRAPLNVVLLALAAGLFALWGPLWGAGVLAADLLGVGALSLTPGAKRAALARRRARERAVRGRRAAAVLARLSESQREKHAQLVRMCAEIDAAWGEKRPLLMGAAEGLHELCDTFALLMAALNEHRRLLGERDRREIGRDLAELDAAPAGAGELSALVEERKKILRERLALVEQAETNREVVSHHLAALEDYVKLLRDRALTGGAAPGEDEGGAAPLVASARQTLDKVQQFVDAASRIGGAALMALLVALGGCSRCARAPAGVAMPPEVVAADARAVGWAPRPVALGATFSALVERSGNEELKRLREDVARQLGFDPLTEEGLRAAGADPAGGLLVAEEGEGGPPLLVVRPASDSTLRATLARLARDRGGATVERTTGARTAWARAEGAAPMVTLLLHRGLALVCGGEKCGVLFDAIETRAPASALAASERWMTARERLGERDVYVLARRAAADGWMVEVNEVAAGLSLTTSEASLRVVAALAPAATARLAGALPGGGGELFARLGPGAPIYLRAGADARAVAGWLDATMFGGTIQRLRVEMKAAGADLDGDLLANMAPGAVAAVDLAPTVDLSRAFVFDPRRTNPFQHFSLQAAARVKDPARARSALRAATKLAPRFGATIEERKPALKVAGPAAGKGANDTMIYRARYALGEGLSFALAGESLFAGGGREDAVDELMSRGAADAQVLPERARAALLAQPGAAFFLDMEPLANTIRALPQEAFGTGPTAFTARSMAENLLTPVSRWRLVAELRPVEGGAQFDAWLELR